MPDASAGMIIASMTTITVLNAASSWYFATQIPHRTTARTALSLLTASLASLNALWAAIYIFSPPDTLVRRCSPAVLTVSALGLLATGLLAALILRREAHRGH
jgi:hypothetical protein